MCIAATIQVRVTVIKIKKISPQMIAKHSTYGQKSGRGQVKISACIDCDPFSLYCLLGSKVLVTPGPDHAYIFKAPSLLNYQACMFLHGSALLWFLGSQGFLMAFSMFQVGNSVILIQSLPHPHPHVHCIN